MNLLYFTLEIPSHYWQRVHRYEPNTIIPISISKFASEGNVFAPPHLTNPSMYTGPNLVTTNTDVQAPNLLPSVKAKDVTMATRKQDRVDLPPHPQLEFPTASSIVPRAGSGPC
jgi:hypothetical protein